MNVLLNKITIILIILVLVSSLNVYGEKTNICNNLNNINKKELQLSKSNIINNDLKIQDGRFIKKLEWTSPNGELPGSYQEYLIKHPIKKPDFKKISPLKTDMYTISILVNETLYPDIQSSLNQYIYDIEFEGYLPVMYTVSGGSAEDIKSWIKDQNNSGSKGIVFIGDITAAWAEVSGSVFPCDLYYMDLDGEWIDGDNDGDFEIHNEGSGDMGPEVYVGRINANTLNYETESNMVNDYLNKTHEYRIGNLTQPWRGLEYVEEDWYDMDVFLDFVYGDDVKRYDYGYFTTASDYLDQMSLGQHFTQVCVHSYSGGHYFSTRPTESASYANTYIFSPTNRNAKLLLGCDDGIMVWLNGNNVYTNDRYGGFSPDQFEVDIILLSGWNQLICKLSQEAGEYKLGARITDMSYNTFNDLYYQVNNPDFYPEEAPFIRSWLLNGFHQDSSGNFWDYLNTNYLGVNESIINPNDGDVMGGKTWTIYNSGFPFVHMSDYCNDADYGVCYGFARVYSNVETDCQIWMGYDDGARIWLNGQEIIYDNRYGEYITDMTKENVTLNEGENTLLVKISEWMGNHGFSARFCNPDGSEVNSLTYYPNPTPISYIGQWLINGPYVNPDKNTRLIDNYLGNESTVKPSEGENASFGIWERGIGNGCPFGIDTFFDHGDWVLSEDVQKNDPPVLFYNLFACGPGRFTDENYLAGAYIFHTTYGLITIASSKSGSMLNFNDFYSPLSQDKNIGESFYEWFEAQSPYLNWEKEWYYGIVICGDPTLSLNPKTMVKIQKPEDALYIRDKKIIPFFLPVSFGKISIEADAINIDVGIDKVEFYIDDKLYDTATSEPYKVIWDSFSFFKHKLKVTAFDNAGNSSSDEILIWKFF